MVKNSNDYTPKHLLKILKMQYNISIDCLCSNSLVMNLKQDYKHVHVTIYVPKYIIKALKQLYHALITKPVQLPAKFVIPTYSAKNMSKQTINQH